MANIVVTDGASATKYLKATGAGSDVDPFVPEHLESNSASIKTAVETLDNAISGSEMQVDVVAALPAGTNTIGATKDAGAAWTSAFGVTSARVTSADATGIVAVTDAPTAGQKIVLTDIIISVGATAMLVDVQEETSATKLISVYMAANSTVQLTPRGKLKLATADKKVMIDTSAAGNVAVTAWYFSEA